MLISILFLKQQLGRSGIIRLISHRTMEIPRQNILFWMQEHNHARPYDRFYTSEFGFAALRGHNGILRVLLEQGANVDGWPDSD